MSRLAAVLLLLGGCSQIRSTSTVKILPKPGAKAMRIGGPSGTITARGAELSWTQQGSTLQVRVVETRVCRELLHHPVVRSEHVVRKPGQAVYWEYGIAAVTLGFGLLALIRPELLSPDAIDENGRVVRDKQTGYRVGGIFTAIGTGFLVAGIYDTVRARDQTYHADAYELELGERVECAAAKVPMRAAEVEVVVGQWRAQAETDGTGAVTFALPAELDVDAPELEAEPASPPAAPEGRGMPEVSAVPLLDSHDLKEGVIRLDPRRAAAFDFAVPFSSAAATTHRGTATLRPIGDAARG